MSKYKSIIRREGNKVRYLKELYELFPEHLAYAEPFVGSMSVWINKPNAPKGNFLNDTSQFVYKFFKCFRENKEKLIRYIEQTPIYADILKDKPIDDYDFVAKNILHSYSSLYGKPIESITSNTEYGRKDKKILLEKMRDKFFNKIREDNIVFSNMDCIKFLKSLSFRDKKDSKNLFVYCDPPYLVSKGNLKDNKDWSEEKLRALIEQLISMNCKFMISEFNDQKVMDIFTEYGLAIKELKESTGIAKTKGLSKIEIVAINYEIKENKLF